MQRFIYVGLLIYLLVFGIALTASAHGSVASYLVLGVEEPSILPDSPFYFLKELGRNIRFFFTFDPVKRAELELHIVDDRLAEIDELTKKSGIKINTLARAIDNYLLSHDRLAKRLDSLRDNNKNIDTLLEKLADRVGKHKELFANLQDNLEKKDMDRVEEKLNSSAESARKDSKAGEKTEKSEMKLEGEAEKKTEIKESPKPTPAPAKKEEPKELAPKETEQPASPPPPASELPTIKPEQKIAEINIQNFAFSPQEIKISVGSEVNWTNKDSSSHTVTGDTGAFESGLLGQDISFKRTFSEKGTFSYHCSPHPNMTGKIIVE